MCRVKSKTFLRVLNSVDHGWLLSIVTILLSFNKSKVLGGAHELMSAISQSYQMPRIKFCMYTECPKKVTEF